ncbi:MAG: hypothetical protein L6R38_005885 [Xanthoria sp. 2 TBL-2021]|nr:MAG: hypothetical protein L6R38_005885 [Xanthoria sp. 2 TBL-2021]
MTPLLQINVPDSELVLLQRKLELARLPTDLDNEGWAENNGVTVKRVKQVLDFWRASYVWREEEAKLNELPQYRAHVDVDGFGDLEVHFVHSQSALKDAIPLLFIHGWPGSIAEVTKILPTLNGNGFHVVAPSLPGYGFSQCPNQPGFKNKNDAEALHKLMLKLGYDRYVVQGGDWGSDIARLVGRLYPEHAKAVHINHVNLSLQTTMPKPKFDKEPDYTDFEKRSIEQQNHFATAEFAYYTVQAEKPRTLGLAMHDSPVGMLAWMMDKLFTWSDNYPWTASELITWTLLHYFPGPTTPFHMYRENDASMKQETPYESTPTGVSAFAGEMEMVPRSWAEKTANIVFWQEHENGGHFAAWENPDALAGDMIKFFRTVWK